MDFKFVTADEREKLYDEVWTEPVTTVAKNYGISDNGLRKHCKRLGIPLPSSGYWAKVKAGQKVQKPALPPVIGELKRHVRNYVIKYRIDIEKLTNTELLSDEELSLLRGETKIFIREKCSQVQVRGQLRNPHHLIEKHKEEVIYRRKRDKALKQASFNANYHARVKSKYRDDEPVLSIDVSESNINRAYRILDTLIKVLEDMEGFTRVRQDSGKATAYFVVMHTAFYFTMKEQAKKERASKDCKEASLVLTLAPESWFTNNISSNMEYKDNDNESIDNQVGKIIYDLFVVANKMMALDELEDREKKRKREEQERQRRLEKMRTGELEEIKLLEQASSDWDKAQKIRRFADCMELKITEVTDQEKRKQLLKWVKWARDKADWLDPLTEKEDELLGQSRYLFDLINDVDL